MPVCDTGAIPVHSLLSSANHYEESEVTDEKVLAAPTAEQLEIAIDEVVSALVAYRRELPEQTQRARDRRPDRDTFETIEITEMMNTPREILRARDLYSSPVEAGLKHSLKELGKLLHAIVGDDGLLEASERICAMDDANWSRRASPINSAWNGIGSWVS